MNPVQLAWTCAAAWIGLVTGVTALMMVAPPVEPLGVALREDTMGLEFFPMRGPEYRAVLAAVEANGLVAADLSDGFRVFMRPGLTKTQQAGRVGVARRMVEAHVGKVRAEARRSYALLGAVMALGPAMAGLVAAGLTTRNRRSLGQHGPGSDTAPSALALSPQSRNKARR